MGIIENNDIVKKEVIDYIEKGVLADKGDVINYIIGRLGCLDKKMYLWIMDLGLEWRRVY